MSSFDMVGRPWAAFFCVFFRGRCCIDVQQPIYVDFYRLFFARIIIFAPKVVVSWMIDEYGEC